MHIALNLLVLVQIAFPDPRLNQEPDGIISVKGISKDLARSWLAIKEKWKRDL